MKTKLIILFLFSLTIGLPVSAWVEPNGTENIVAPLNTSSTAQTKAGDLGTNGSLCIKGDCKSAWPTSSSDTLQTVTERGNSTNRNVDFLGNLTVGSSTWSRIQFYASINDTYNPISGASDRAHFHFGFPNTPVGKEPLIETPSDVWIIGGNHNLKVDGTTSTGNLCLGGECRNNWCPAGYFSVFRDLGSGGHYVCQKKDYELSCTQMCSPSYDENGYPIGESCYSTNNINYIYFAARYINGEKYTRAYGWDYWLGSCDSGYVKGTSANCTINWRNFYYIQVKANWTTPDPGGIRGTFSNNNSSEVRFYCNAGFPL